MIDRYGDKLDEIGHWIQCPQCGETTEYFADGVCSDCSLANQMEIDLHLETFESWNKLSDAERNRLIREKLIYAEHFTEEHEEDGEDPDTFYP